MSRNNKWSCCVKLTKFSRDMPFKVPQMPLEMPYNEREPVQGTFFHAGLIRSNARYTFHRKEGNYGT